MFDIAWSEMAVILVVALIVIGPKDIPIVLKTVKEWIRKLQSAKQAIASVLQEITQETEMVDVQKQLQGHAAEINQTIRQIVDLEGNLRDAYDISDLRPDLKPDYSTASTPAPQQLPASPAVIENYSVNKKTVH